MAWYILFVSRHFGVCVFDASASVGAFFCFWELLPMIITFCGHSDFVGNQEYEEKILSFLEENVGNSPAELFLGGYGAFDDFAYGCSKKYKHGHPNVSLVFVTPYITAEYQKNHLEYASTVYDSILYPDLENVPPRFAISRRNKYMAEKADILIAYIDRAYGGAYQTYKLAKGKGKRIFNLAKGD